MAVAPQTSTERGVLLLHRPMPMATTPVVDGLLGPSEARPPCLAPHPPVTFPCARPIERAPQKVQGSRSFAPLRRLWRTPQGQPPRLGRVQGEAEAPQPCAEHAYDTSCIVLQLKADEEVVTRAHQGGFPLKPWRHLGFTPQVEHGMQVPIAQQR
jgi:hypothetical protein